MKALIPKRPVLGEKLKEMNRRETDIVERAERRFETPTLGQCFAVDEWKWRERETQLLPIECPL